LRSDHFLYELHERRVLRHWMLRVGRVVRHQRSGADVPMQRGRGLRHR
jgi:hypothetical protein